MTTVPDPYPAGLDPAHILAICVHATGGRPGLAVGARDGICVCLPSRRAARSAGVALARVGYQVIANSGPRGRDAVVTGWSPAGLESRLTAMRAVLHQLADNPPLTARAVIERFRSLPGTSHSPHAGLAILQQARTGLRSWVSARSGIHAPRPPAVLPPDVGIALRLGTAGVLEQVIDDLTNAVSGSPGMRSHCSARCRSRWTSAVPRKRPSAGQASPSTSADPPPRTPRTSSTRCCGFPAPTGHPPRSPAVSRGPGRPRVPPLSSSAQAPAARQPSSHLPQPHRLVRADAAPALAVQGCALDHRARRVPGRRPRTVAATGRAARAGHGEIW